MANENLEWDPLELHKRLKQANINVFESLEARAEISCQMGNYRNVIDDYSQIIAQSEYGLINGFYSKKDLSTLYTRRGLSLNKIEKFDDAILDFDRAIDNDSENSIAYDHRGRAKSRLGRLDDALIDFSDAVRIDPSCGVALTQRGLVNNKLGNHERAIEDFNESEKLDSSDPMIFYGRGVARSNIMDFEGSLGDLDIAINIWNKSYSSSWSPIYHQRGLAKYFLGKVDDALEDFNEAISHDNEFSKSYAWRARIFEEKGDKKKATSGYRAVLYHLEKIPFESLSREDIRNLLRATQGLRRLGEDMSDRMGKYETLDGLINYKKIV
jgi:tetratricopeptide (TPR) repeat protein